MRWFGLFGVLASLLIQDSLRSQDKPAPPPGAEAEALPARAIQRLGTARLRHGSRILCLAYAPNGRILAAGGGDDPVRLWDTETGKEILRIKEPWVHAIAFTPRGSVMATAGAFKTIRLWETATGKEIATAKLEGHATAVKAMAISPDGSMLASGSQDGLVILWELLTSKIITQFKGHTDEITSLAFSADSTHLVSGSSDRTVRIWDCDNAKLTRTLDGGCGVLAVSFVREGKAVASGGDDNLVRLWDVASGKLLDAMKGHEGPVMSLAAGPGGKMLISGGYDKTIRVWHLLDGAMAMQIFQRDLGDSDALALSKNGKFLACAGTNNTIRVFDIEKGQEVLMAPGHQAVIASMALSRDGKLLASGSATGKIRLWDSQTGKEIRHWVSPDGGDLVLAFAPDGATLVSARGGGALRFWDPNTGREKMQLPAGQGDPVLSLTYSPDGTHLAVGRRNGPIDLWHVPGKKVVQQLTYKGPVYALTYSPSGKILAASGGVQIALYDVESGKEVRKFDSKEGPPGSLPAIASLAFSPDGKTLAAGCYDAVLRLYDSGTGKEIRALEGHTGVPYGLAFSADGRILASGSFDRGVRLWETFSGLSIATLAGHQGPVTALAFLPSGRGVFSGSADTSILHWDVTGTSKDGTLPKMSLGQPDLQNAWAQLASEDAANGQAALWRLVAGSADSVPFLEKQLYLVDPKVVDQLFKDLDSPQFAVRKKSSEEIKKYGRWMEGRLRELQKNPPTLEVQRRVDQLLADLAVPGSSTLAQERLRVRRVMLALEQVASPEALAVLTKLANGAPEVELQNEARGSVERLDKRGKQ